MTKADLAIAQILIGITISATTLVIGFFMYRRGMRTRDVKLRVKAYVLWVVGGLLTGVLFFPALAYLYTEHLWFESVGYDNIFWEILKTRWGLLFKFFLVAVGFMGLNLFLGDRLCPVSREFARWTRERTNHFYYTMFIVIIFMAFLLAVPMMFLWDDFLRDDHQISSNIIEPVFEKELGFFLFSFPIHYWMSIWVKVLLWTTVLIVALSYNFYYRRDPQTMARVEHYLVFHGSALWLMLLAADIWRNRINIWNVLFTTKTPWGFGRVSGMGYVDDKLIGAYKLYTVCLIVIGILILLNLLWRNRRIWYWTIAAWGASYLILIQIYPLFVHGTQVRPNPLTAEVPFLDGHIDSTRRAFGLDGIEKKDHIQGAATFEMIDRNLEVKENIQLWDRRVLYEVLRDQQTIKPYYEFHRYTDVDRYWVAGKYRQVLVAAREVDPSELLEAQEWVNRKLIYTHGYGVCVAPVNEFIENEGNPNFWLKGLNPFLFSLDLKFQSDLDNNNFSTDLRQVFKDNESLLSQNTLVEKRDNKWLITDNSNRRTYNVLKAEGKLKVYPELVVTQPQIYYGELTRDYAIVNTTQKEIDPEGAQYKGEGRDKRDGVRIGGWFRRLCFATRFDFWRMLLSKDLTSESRILFRREIGTRKPDSAKTTADRISHIAPFLKYDPDPYIVIGNDGQLWWIIDIYVTSRSYPNAKTYEDKTNLVENPLYSEPTFDRFNYIRNPAVAVVSAYNGEVNFYFTKDDEEPITAAYQKAFPNLFKSRDEIPAGLQNHLRYPDYFTRIQAEMYADYHVDHPESFYHGSDRWTIPEETYYSNKQTMVPYYAILKLPGEEKSEFVNMIPFTPPKRVKLMNAWLVARSDAEHYGKLIVYTLPEQEIVLGPKQVEDDIETALANEVWFKSSDEKGSQVIRGNLLVIPVEDALFYVEPIYLKPKGSNRAKLQVVVVRAGDKLAYAETWEALRKIFGVGIGVESGGDTENRAEPAIPMLDELTKLANERYNQYFQLTGEGKFAEAAEAFTELGDILKALAAGKYQKEGEKTSNIKREIDYNSIVTQSIKE